MSVWLVFLGGGIGSVLRYGMSSISVRWVGSGFPYGTLAINVLGSFLMGAVAQYFLVRTGLPQGLRLFLTTGLLGGFTTFSTFSLESVLLYQRGDTAAAASYVLASIVLGLGGLIAGWTLLRHLGA